jgi:hypothetical protein
MTSVSDLQALLSVPKLKTNGSNWIIFSVCLKWALQEKKVFGHLDSTSPQSATTADADKQTTWTDNEAKARWKGTPSSIGQSLQTNLFHLLWESIL